MATATQDKRAVSARSFAVITGCLLANIVDGFDVLAIAFTGSAIMAEWQLSPAVLGMLFSAGLAGMMLGSLFIAPLADRYGRRPVSLACMVGMTLGMFASAFATGPETLAFARLATGLGIGGVLAALNTIVAETARPERRNTILALFSAGYPLGSIFGGLIALSLVSTYGWRPVFLLGGGLTLVVLLVNLFTLPESSTPTGRAKLLSADFFRRLAGGGRTGVIVAFCVAFALHMMTFFFILNWTPKLVEELGYSPDTGNSVTVVINIGSLLGPLIFGWLADRLGLFRMATAYFVLFAVATLAMGFVPASLGAIYALAIVIGLAMAGAMTSLYASAPLIFPAQVRAAGTGLAIGVGRAGGTLGPAIAGWAIVTGFGRPALYGLFTVPLLVVVALFALGLIRASSEAQEELAR